MRWFVYPDLDSEQIEQCRGVSGATYFAAIPHVGSFLAPFVEKVERTDDPEEASYFLIPAVVDVPFHEPLSAEFEAACTRFTGLFPFFRKVPERHVFFLLGDNTFVPTACGQSIVFMPSCPLTARALPLCYFAEPPATEPGPISDAEFDVSFQGTVRTGGGLRSRVVKALHECRTRSICCRVTDGYFHMTYDWPQQRALRDEYTALIAQSRFVFCPRGDGLTSLRFFETLAFGRIPILVADDTALPLEGEIAYDEFMVRVPERQVENWEVYLDAFLLAHPYLEVRSSLARNAYLLWFTLSSLNRLVERSLRNRARNSAVNPLRIAQQAYLLAGERRAPRPAPLEEFKGAATVGRASVPASRTWRCCATLANQLCSNTPEWSA